MNRIDRLFGILTLLQSRKFVNGEKISEKFGISIRTVYRDIKALGGQGIPVGFEMHKGYFIVHGYFLPPVSFNSEEANALALMETLISGFADKSIQKHYSNALNKVKSVLKTSQRDKLEQLSSQIKVQLPSCIDTNFDYLSIMQNSISAKQCIEIEYTDNKNLISCRKIEPIGLIFYAYSWHVIAWCHLRNDYRDFKVFRIHKITNTGDAFIKTDHIPLGDYMKLLPVDY